MARKKVLEQLKNYRCKLHLCVCSGDYVTISCHDTKFINALELISNMYLKMYLIDCRS